MEKVKGLAILSRGNDRNRFFIPSRENIFGGLIVPYVMIDTGCNTLLLPMSDSITDLISLFPCSRYMWSIAYSNGVGAMSSPVLMIRCISVADIKISLCNDICPFDVIIDRLRFHLSYDDVSRLILSTDVGKLLTPAHVDLLRQYADLVDQIRLIRPGVSIGTKRRHALLGQSIIEGNHMTVVQRNGVAIMFDGKYPYRDISDDDLVDIRFNCDNNIVTKFGNNGKEFFELEDDDHDEDYYVTVHTRDDVDE